MISKGKLRYIRRVVAMQVFLRAMGRAGTVDVFAMAQLSTRCRPNPAASKVEFDLRKAVGTPESWYEVNKISTEVIQDMMRRQAQQIVHKPRLVCREVDHSDPTITLTSPILLPFLEQGPL